MTGARGASEPVAERDAECQAIVAVFAYGAERCLREAVARVHCEDVFCSMTHPVCEQHSIDAEREQGDR